MLSTVGASLRVLLALFCVLLAWSSGTALASDAPSVDVTYELGPGDTIRVEVLGQAEMSGSFPVGTDGAIDIPYAGRVGVAGHTLAGAKEQIEARLRDGYVLNPQVVVVVEQITSKLVKVTGGVVTPGEYPLTKRVVHVSDVLVRAGGLVDPATPRAELWREVAGAREVVPVDLYLVSKGDAGADVVVLPGDSLVVPQAQLIFIDGMVQKPGSLPFRDGMTLSTAVAAAGGFTGTALRSKVKLIRGETQIVVNLRRVLQGLDADVALKPGDHVNVPESAI